MRMPVIHMWLSHIHMWLNHMLCLCVYLCMCERKTFSEWERESLMRKPVIHIHMWLNHISSIFMCDSSICCAYVCMWKIKTFCEWVRESLMCMPFIHSGYSRQSICRHMSVCVCVCVRERKWLSERVLDVYACHSYVSYGVATISRLLKIIGLFCKRAL